MKKFLVISGIALIFIGVFVVKTLNDAGEFKTIEPHFNGSVKKINGIVGGEDITIDYEKRIAYISADDRFATLNGRKGFGGFYALYLDSPVVAPKLIQRNPDHEIHPHGISYYKSPDGQAYLYAVDHTDGSSSILLFRFENNLKLVLVQRFRDSTFIISPNDVAAVDEQRFYFTNDHGSHSSFGKKMEDYLQMKKANVTYYDGKSYSIPAGRIGYANGINISRDKNEVYLAATIARGIFVYDYKAMDGQLTFKSYTYLNTGVDNIELDEAGNLWVACHPQLLTFVKHAKDTSKLAPSQVLKLTRDDNGKYTSEEVYLNSGKELSASSVAAVAGNILLIGPVLDDHILRCELR